jgi:23S rRNA pseudouridine2604 synthase
MKNAARAGEEYPMRINKYLAHKGVATRRGVDELIDKGVVRINGRVAVRGDKVEKGDEVEVSAKRKVANLQYFAYHKPVGVITHSPQRGEEDIKKNIAGDPALSDIFPVGRLDKASSGLLILTNDGRVTDRLLNPEYEHDKEYKVETARPLRDSFAKYMERGVDIGDYVTKPAQVKPVGPTSFTITLTEGKKHQIRRMVSALHNDVASLMRTRILNIRLGDLAPGDARPILGEELAKFLKSLGL